MNDLNSPTDCANFSEHFGTFWLFVAHKMAELWNFLSQKSDPKMFAHDDAWKRLYSNYTILRSLFYVFLGIERLFRDFIERLYWSNLDKYR